MVEDQPAGAPPRDAPTLASTVYEKLREDIASASILPGERLGMDTLRARYDVGGSPLREALNRLVSEGLVTQEDRKGFRVAPVSQEELRELTRARQLIHEVALREAIRNGDVAWEEGIIIAYHRMNSRRGSRQVLGIGTIPPRVPPRANFCLRLANHSPDQPAALRSSQAISNPLDFTWSASPRRSRGTSKDHGGGIGA